MRDRDGRPARREVDPAALALIARHGPQILRVARRHSANLADAEDAYQRGLEILLTKAPSVSADELVPWLKTVVKHEAWALRRARERAVPVTDDGELSDGGGAPDQTEEAAERLERLAHSVEALGSLKPHEVRALVLRAEGYSYRQICALTGWSYTKVNRCLTEGRRAFIDRIAGIEAGTECERLMPLVSALADGEASADDLRAVRPHLRTCLSCRARLREFRAAPARVAAVLPPIAVAAPASAGPLRSFCESLLGATQHKAAALGERTHAIAELAAGQKVAAVAASAAALAGGGAGVTELTAPGRSDVREQISADLPARTQPAPGAPIPATPPAAVQPGPAVPPSRTASDASPAPDPPRPNPAAEFDPGAAPTLTPRPAAASPAPSRRAAVPALTEFAP